MNKPFRVCLLPVLLFIPDAYKMHEGWRKEKVGCKRGIEDVDRCCMPAVSLCSVSYPMAQIF